MAFVFPGCDATSVPGFPFLFIRSIKPSGPTFEPIAMRFLNRQRMPRESSGNKAPHAMRPGTRTPNTPANVTWASAGDGAKAGSTPSLAQLPEDSGASKVPQVQGFS